MWTFRTVLAIGLFLFGTTFLWMTPSMTNTVPPPTGRMWTLTNVLAILAIVAFSATAWAVFKQYSWWSPAALVSGIIGLVAVVPFVLAQRQLEVGLGDMGVQINLWMHALGSALVLGIGLVPTARDWVAQRL
jgi:hypothetical protein